MKMGELVQSRVHRRGFTLTELLVMVAMVVIVAMTLLPAFAKTRFRAQEVTCLNNLRQMMVGWQTYADNNNGRFVLNLPSARFSRSWVMGDMSIASDRADISLITNGLLYPYTKSVKSYKCPGGRANNSVRGISMNIFIGASISNNGYQNYLKASSLNNPSQIFVFIDEDENTINDGAFRIDGQPLSAAIRLNDFPASYHNGGCGIGFADGRAEIHLWKGLRSGMVDNPATGLTPSGDGQQDCQYLMQIATTPASGSW